jgi:hypothetical protein
MDDLRDRQRAERRRHLAHLRARRHRHQRVVAVVVGAAEGARVGERRGADQLRRRDARAQLSDQLRQELVGRGLLHQVDQRIERSEVQPLAARDEGGERLPESEPVEQRAAERRSADPDSHATEELPPAHALTASHDESPREGRPQTIPAARSRRGRRRARRDSGVGRGAAAAVGGVAQRRRHPLAREAAQQERVADGARDLQRGARLDEEAVDLAVVGSRGSRRRGSPGRSG